MRRLLSWRAGRARPRAAGPRRMCSRSARDGEPPLQPHMASLYVSLRRLCEVVREVMHEVESPEERRAGGAAHVRTTHTEPCTMRGAPSDRPMADGALRLADGGWPGGGRCQSHSPTAVRGRKTREWTHISHSVRAQNSERRVPGGERAVVQSRCRAVETPECAGPLSPVHTRRHYGVG